MIDKPGIYREISEADYFADPCPEPSFTQSIGKLILDRSPAHAKLAHPRLAPPPTEGEDETPEKYVAAQAIGNAAHKLILNRGRDLVVCDFDSWRSDKAKQARADAEISGHIPILKKHHRRAEAMVTLAVCQLVEFDLPHVFSSPGETVISWQEDGLWFRSLIDWLTPSLTGCWDFKTTGLSVAPHAIPKLMTDANWPLQAAMHERGLDVLDPDNAGRRKFYFVAQENAAPFALTVCQLPESTMTMGRKQLAMAIGIWRNCMRTKSWPAYPAEVLYPELPGWRETQWLDREIQFEQFVEVTERAAASNDFLMGG
jgi:hypothetical protein